MAAKRWITRDQFVVATRPGEDAISVTCCVCGPDAGLVARFNLAFAVSDLAREIDEHIWRHGVAEKHGIPMSEFGAKPVRA